MFDKIVVCAALKYSLAQGQDASDDPSHENATLVSRLIHDIFGGEILKTHLKNGWHFYNRIEGKRIDFTSPHISRSFDDIQFEDIPSTPDETNSYFEDEEYSDFLMRFIWAFEEAIGLDKYRPGLTA